MTLDNLGPLIIIIFIASIMHFGLFAFFVVSIWQGNKELKEQQEINRELREQNRKLYYDKAYYQNKSEDYDNFLRVVRGENEKWL